MGSLLDDIYEQPRLLATIGRAYLKAHGNQLQQWAERLQAEPRQLIFVGMGSSLFAGVFASYLLSRAGIWSQYQDASELLHHRLPALPGDAMLVAVSQSGETIETRKVVQALRGRLPIIAVTNNPQSSIAAQSDHVFPLWAGTETGTSTKTYTAELAVLALLCGALAGQVETVAEELVTAAESLEGFLKDWERQLDPAFAVLRGAVAIDFLGDGPSYATALMGGLLLKEVMHLPGEGLTCGQFKHGVVELVDSNYRCVLLSHPGETHQLNLKLARRIASLGGVVCWISSEPPGVLPTNIVSIQSPVLPSRLAPLGDILPVQLLACRIAQAKGREPGVLQQMGKVTLEE